MRKIGKVRRIKKIRKKKTYVSRKKEDVGTSKIEKEFGFFLSRFGIALEEQHQIGYRFFDFKVKDKNILIEFQGDFWHYNPETQKNLPNAMQRKNMKNDKLKRTLAESNSFRLLYIWENDYRYKKQEVIDKVLKFINE